MHRRWIFLPLVVALLSATSGCSIPLINKKDQVKKPCEYREVFSVATLQSMDSGTVTFEVSGYREVIREISSLPAHFSYSPGDEFNVRQRFLTRGDCDEYKFEILQKL